MKKKPLKFLIADDHAVVRRGVKDLLEEEFPGAIFSEVATAQAALEYVWKQPCDLIVLDITMPGRSGLDILKDLKDAQPKTPVLVQSMHAEDQFAVRVFKAGGSGYLTKDSMPEEIVRAVRRLLEGGRYVSAALAENLAGVLAAGAARPAHELLSDREFQVLRMLAAGRAVKEIGAELSLSMKTISTYRTRIFEKLNVRTNQDLTRYALREGLVE